jgi:FAD dependent oxidoreductase
MKCFIVVLLAGQLFAQTYEVVDVQNVPATGDYRSAILKVQAPSKPSEITCEALVAGAGAGGIAATLRLLERGHGVCLAEETDIIGGQFHSVPALDEHKFIEISGATRSYHEFRNAIRDHYRKAYQLAPAAEQLKNFNPGACYVSSLCYEPKVAINILQQMLKPYGTRLQLLLRTKVIDASISNHSIQSVLAYRFDTREVIRIRTGFVLDATETGDLLPIAKVPYIVGSEARSETAEPHAAPEPNPACVQSFTYTFAIDFDPAGEHRIPKPAGYERIRDSQPFTLRMNYPTEFGWRGAFQYSVFGEDPPVPNNMSPKPFFPWRRLLARRNFQGASAPQDLALMNWPRQDYHDESLLDRSAEDTARILQAAKNVSFSFLYWLQNDVPRDDGKGSGYAGFRLRKDVMESQDGLSKYPYIRESRRIRVKEPVREQDLRIDDAQAVRARWYPDSIGTGFYMVDIHPCGANERGRMMMPKPFQIPVSALFPQGVTNMLAAGKNIGVTHLTNGAFRLHPIEWNVGESAAVIASIVLKFRRVPPAAEVQAELVRNGVPIVWFDDLGTNHPDFAAVHLAAIRGLYPLDSHNLHASPQSPVTRGEAAAILTTYMGNPLQGQAAIDHVVREGWMAVDHRNWFHETLPFYWTDWRQDRLPKPLPAIVMTHTGPVTRAELAHRLVR